MRLLEIPDQHRVAGDLLARQIEPLAVRAPGVGDSAAVVEVGQLLRRPAVQRLAATPGRRSNRDRSMPRRRAASAVPMDPFTSMLITGAPPSAGMTSRNVRVTVIVCTPNSDRDMLAVWGNRCR